MFVREQVEAVRRHPVRIDNARSRAIELVRRFKSGGFATDAENERAMAELESLVPDPRVSEIIFWPHRHELAKSYDAEELTAEAIVDLAMQYKPFAL